MLCSTLQGTHTVCTACEPPGSRASARSINTPPRHGKQHAVRVFLLHHRLLSPCPRPPEVQSSQRSQDPCWDRGSFTCRELPLQPPCQAGQQTGALAQMASVGMSSSGTCLFGAEPQVTVWDLEGNIKLC